MADEKLNTGPGSEKLPEAPEQAATPTPRQEQAAAPQQEQAGLAQPAPGDVVVSFDKINELMGEKRQAARAQVEKEAAGDRKSTRLNSSHIATSRMPSSA